MMFTRGWRMAQLGKKAYKRQKLPNTEKEIPNKEPAELYIPDIEPAVLLQDIPDIELDIEPAEQQGIFMPDADANNLEFEDNSLLRELVSSLQPGCVIGSESVSDDILEVEPTITIGDILENIPDTARSIDNTHDDSYVPETDNESNCSSNNMIPPSPNATTSKRKFPFRDAVAAIPVKIAAQSVSQCNNNLQALKHPMLEPCICRAACSNLVDKSLSEKIHSSYWSENYNQRKQWLFDHISRAKRSDLPSKRSPSIQYMLPGPNGKDVRVCQKMFLHVLGYTSNKVVVSLLQSTGSDLFPPGDKRGKHYPKHKLTEANCTMIQEHIKSFNPSISHYRRAHAPNRLYLGNDLTIREMHEDFRVKHPDVPCSYVTYGRQVREMNISFTKLGEEQCEVCETYNLHTHDGDPCTTCMNWTEHNEKAKESRISYQSDAEKSTSNSDPDTRYASVDMQKIILLPRMPGMKVCLFTRRLVVFHLTFAPLGKTAEKPTGIIWHEGISGRSAEDIASAYLTNITHEKNRDFKKWVLWADNCSGQNKCWILYTALIAELNKPTNQVESITVKYLERGHTFMSADSFHHRVEDQMKKSQNLYDFNDFLTVVAKCGVAIQMPFSDFALFKNESSNAKGINKPLLHPIKEVQFRKDDTNLYYKNRHNEDWKQVNFLKKKVKENIKNLSGSISRRSGARGIQTSKLRDIKKNLLPLMPNNRHSFWNQLQADDGNNDLAENYE